MSCLPKSRREAKDAGIKKYNTGKLCKHGHYSDRETLGGACLVCKSARDLSYRQRNYDRKTDNDRRYREENKEKIKESQRKYRENNKDILAKRKLEERIKNKDYYVEYHKRYYEENYLRIRSQKQDYYENNKEYIINKVKKHNAENKHMLYARVRRHQLEKIDRTPAWADMNRISEIYKDCLDINNITGIKHHVDHIIPLRGRNVSGLHVHDNLRVIPAKENLSKSNMFIEELIE